MKTLLVLSLILAGANAMASNTAFSQGLSDYVTQLPKDPTGADLECNSASGKTALYAALPGDLKGTAVVIKINGQVSTDIDQDYADEAKARDFDVFSKLSNLKIGQINQNATGNFAMTGPRFQLKNIPGTTKTKIEDHGESGTIRFQALLTTPEFSNIRVSCVEEWAL